MTSGRMIPTYGDGDSYTTYDENHNNIMRVIRNRPCLDASSETIHLNFHCHCVRIQMWSECANEINYIWRLLCTIWVICLCVISKYRTKQKISVRVRCFVSLSLMCDLRRFLNDKSPWGTERIHCIESRSLLLESKYICHNFVHFKMSNGNNWGAAYFLRRNILSLDNVPTPRCRYVCSKQNRKKTKP